MIPTNPNSNSQPNPTPVARNQVLILISQQLLSRIVATQRALNTFAARTPEEEPPPILLQLPSVVQAEACSAYLTLSLLLRPHTPPEVTGTEYQLERALHALLTFPSISALTIEDPPEAHQCEP